MNKNAELIIKTADLSIKYFQIPWIVYIFQFFQFYDFSRYGIYCSAVDT